MKGSSRETAAIILAAGKSTRMKSTLPKVLHEVCGRAMLAYAIEACRGAGIEKIYVVVGFGKDEVIKAFGNEPGIHFVEQTEQKGTGHAVSMCQDALKGFDGDCVVIAGDMPLIRTETLRDLLGAHRASGAAASLATTILDDPSGYGRIVRDAAGRFGRIIEDRDCDEAHRHIKEVNPSYYCFDVKAMFEALPQVKPNNAKGEYYITDVLEIIRASGKEVRASVTLPAEDATGINSRADLAAVNKLMQRRICNQWMDRGVTIVDPDNTWIDGRALIGEQTVIQPFSYIEGRSRIGASCVVGPFAYVCDGAVVGDSERVGPGVLTALDATHSEKRPAASAPARRHVQVVRRPPAQSNA